MNTKLVKHLKQLEKSKTELLLLLQNIDSAKLILQPNPNSWSVVQVISHLIRVEEGTIKYLRKKLSYNPPLKKAGLMSTFKTWGLKKIIELPIKYKTSDSLEEKSNSTSYEDALSLWEENRTSMTLFLETLSEEQLSAEIYKNLMVGQISIYQQLDFLQTHFERHTKQIKKILQP